jgi:branched-chain amino acid transport system permease protein
MGFIDAILQGILLGALYALFALGLSLMFGVMRLVNIAHGDMIIAAAFAGYALAALAGLGPWLALAALLPVAFAAGYVLQRAVLNRTLGGDILPPLLVTFGLSIVIQNLLLEVFSADSRSIPGRGIETASLALGHGLALGWLPLMILVTALAATAGLEWLFGRTAIGRAFRATSDDRDTAGLMGIDPRHVYAIATGLGVTLVAVAGVFHGMRTTIAPTDGPAQLLYAFEAVVIGGLGSFWGTFAGGLILGVAQSIGFRLDPGWGLLVGHGIFLVVLLWRPTGLFPRTR